MRSRGLLAFAVVAVVLSSCTVHTESGGSTASDHRSGPAVNCASIGLTYSTSGQLFIADGAPLRASATLDGVVATLSGSVTTLSFPPNQLALAGAKLEITVKGKPVLSSDVTTPGAHDRSPILPGSIGSVSVPVWAGATAAVEPTSLSPLCVARFGGADPETAVLLGLYTGAMHCCTWVDAYPVRAGGVPSSPIQYQVGNVLGGIVETGGHAAIVTADDAFDYRFQSFGGSGEPILVLEVRNGRFVRTTPTQLDWVEADAGYWWGLFVDSQPGQGLGVLASWAADECLLGQGRDSLSTLDRLETQGRLSSPNTYWPSGATYLTQLRSFLSAHGYC